MHQLDRFLLKVVRINSFLFVENLSNHVLIVLDILGPFFESEAQLLQKDAISTEFDKLVGLISPLLQNNVHHLDQTWI